MIASGRVAYANARVRALKSQLFGPEVVGRLRTDRDIPTSSAADKDAARDVGVSRGVSDLPERRFSHLLRCYRVVLSSYPSGQTLFQSLVRLHEVENLKLAWRARTVGHPFERWGPLWRALGSLESVRLEECRDQTSLSGLVASLRATPYSVIADATWRAHADDLLASELALDRWASASIARAAFSLGRAEATARDLALAVVRERDLNLLRRGAQAFGLSPDAVLGGLVLLPSELPADDLSRLAAWAPHSGRFLRAWPTAWGPTADRPADWDALLLAVRRARRRACRRAFLGSPYCLGPAMALLLLQEEEVRALMSLSEVSIREMAGRPDTDLPLERVLAASAMGG
jgi:vacuolar-type H+-ATPase subunit C/Vma6